MDASNTQASYSPRRSGGASSQIDDIYESALKKAREMDRQPKRQLTPSAPQLRDSTGRKEFSMLRPGASVSTEGATGQVRRALDRFSDRGMIDTVLHSETWDDPHEAEYGLQQWSAELDELTRQLSEREDGIINAHSELERLGQSLKSQEDVDRYNTMVEAYNEGLNQYQELYSDYERLYGRYGEGVVKYRELLGSGAERAVSYRDEAERLIERNEELDVQMASQRTNAATAATAAEREAALEAYGKLEAEYDKNRSEIARLNNEASEAQWEYYSSLRLNDDFDALSAPMGSQRVAQGRAGESPYYFRRDSVRLHKRDRKRAADARI